MPPASHSRTGSPACNAAHSPSPSWPSSRLSRSPGTPTRQSATSRGSPRARPTGIDASWFDDHSVIGDDHLSWSDQGAPPYYSNDSGQASQSEPKAIGFDPALTVSGPGGLEVCGYPSGTVGWMRAYQAAPGVLTAGGSCPAAEPAGGQFGWFRYVYGRHSSTYAFNRWHLMDLERFALVPLPAAAGGPPGGTPTVWDNHWGTCLGLATAAADVGCPTNRSAGGSTSGSPRAPRSRRGSTTRRRPAHRASSTSRSSRSR